MRGGSVGLDCLEALSCIVLFRINVMLCQAVLYFLVLAGGINLILLGTWEASGFAGVVVWRGVFSGFLSPEVPLYVYRHCLS